jgi:hypothetical protein
MHGFLKATTKRPRRIRQARSQFRNGERVAVVRAWTAAKLHRGEQIAPQSLAVASTLCGASLPYVAAMELDEKLQDQLDDFLGKGGRVS